MNFLDRIKKIYWKYLSFKWLNRQIYKILEGGTNLLASWQHFYFPQEYIRHWKIDMLFGWYEKESTALFKKIIKSGMIAVDIGAHIGYYTRLYSRLVGDGGKVYAFEADPKNFELLKKNTAHLNNTKIYQVAVTDHAGPVDFYESEEKTGCHSTVFGVIPNQKKITVPGGDLDAIFAKEGVDKIDVIKMDIEGGEPTAVKGMRNLLLNNPQIILITELSSSRLNAGHITPFEYLQQLAGLGFYFSLIDADRLIPIDLQPEKISELFKISDFINVYCSRI